MLDHEEIDYDEKGNPTNIDDLLKSVNAGVETKRVSTTPKKGGSTGKNSVSIRL